MGQEQAKNRLKELMELKGITVEALAKLCHVAEKTISADINGNRTFQTERAIPIAQKYEVSLDWLYGVDEHMNAYDMMADLILALDKVFRVIIKQAEYIKGDKTYDLSEPALYIDRTFLQYLREIRELQDYIEHSGRSKEEYQGHRKEIQTRYKDKLQEIFETDEFNKERFVEIKRVEEAPDHPSFLDFLG